MIKTADCSVNDIRRQLELQLDYDPEAIVISIVPIKFEMLNGFGPNSMATTNVKIIWEAR